METQAVPKQLDNLLRPFLQASQESERHAQLNRLLEAHARPIIEGILRRKLSLRSRPTDDRGPGQVEQDREDLYGDIVAQLLGKLEALRSGAVNEVIGDFPAYIAGIAYHAVSRHLRAKHPLRFQLQNKLRYLLEHREGLAVWQGEPGRWLAGFAAWRDGNRTCPPAGKAKALCDDPQRFAREALDGDSPTQMDPARLLAAIFGHTGHPLELDDLVAIVAELWNVRDLPAAALFTQEALSSQDSMAAQPAAMPGHRLDLHRYWIEILQLAPRQCAALLLQARDPDGNCLIELLETERIATLRQMAQAMAMPPETLVALWNGLPLEDTQIASQIGCHPAHVARLRMTARKLLAARMHLAGESM